MSGRDGLDPRVRGDDEQPAGTSTHAVSRREFVAVGAAALVGLTCKGSGRPLAGALMDDGPDVGHRLRDGAAPPVGRRAERASVVIVGGGAAGLSAAWWLARHGMRDFVLLELASRPGGNARSGENAVSAYPWGAHYVPVPGPRATLVRLLLEEMGILSPAGEWRERDLCQAPKERLFAHGRWREGLVEPLALGAADDAELRRFDDRVRALRERGAFTIPMALGMDAASPESAALDTLTAEAWLAREGFRSPAVRWLVDYACRDDFGTRARDASAWAALHYFAARDAEDPGPLTWPEGNGRLVRYLAERVAGHVRTGAPVWRVSRDARTGGGSSLRVLAGDPSLVSGQATEWSCDAVIWAAPTFLASHVVEGAPPVPWRYAPWMVSNLTLDRRPASAPDEADEAWDNVIADSPALGYVVATHQSLRAAPEPRTVWTHYWALADEAPAAARRRLLAADWRACAESVLADLARAHPDVRACVSRVDVLRYGHAMPRPEPGFLAAHRAWWDAPRDARVLWANSDVSGLSLFEEAQYRGVRAAERALELVGRG